MLPSVLVVQEMREDEGKWLLTEADGQKVLPRQDQLLVVNNIIAINTLEDIVVAMTTILHQLLDLMAVELGVGDHGKVGSERANDTVRAEGCNAIIVGFQGTDEVVDVRLGSVLLQSCQR